MVEEVESMVTHNGEGRPVKKVVLLKDDMEFYYVNVYDYQMPERTKVSPPILGASDAIRQYDLCCLGVCEDILYS